MLIDIMTVNYLVEIFGGTGAVILGVGTCIWGCLKSYELKYDYDEEDKEERRRTRRNAEERE